MTEEEKGSQYNQLKDERQKTLVKEYEEFLMKMKVQIGARDSVECQKLATKWGEVDEIDEKVCLKARLRAANHLLMSVLPELTQHAHNYEQCLQECSKNHISYVVANHSCKAVYQKNFKATTQAIAARLLARGGIDKL